MDTVILFGQQQQEYSDFIAGELGKRHFVHCVFPGCVETRGNGQNPPLLLIGKNEHLKVKYPCVLVFAHNQTPYSLDICGQVISIVDETNTRALSMLRQCGQAVVSCGMGQKSTVSIASISEDSAVVSIQRQMKTLTGELIEPHDLKISLRRPLKEFPLMSLCVLLLLTGHRDPNDCYEI